MKISSIKENILVVIKCHVVLPKSILDSIQALKLATIFYTEVIKRISLLKKIFLNIRLKPCILNFCVSNSKIIEE